MVVFRMENNLDIAVRAARPLIFIGAALCLPIFLVTYANLILIALKEWPVWASALTVISHIVLIIGLGCLHDAQQEARQERGPL